MSGLNGEPRPPRSPLDIVCLVDLKIAANARSHHDDSMLKQLNPCDRFQLMTFAEQTSVVFPIQLMCPAAMEHACGNIQAMVARGRHSNFTGGLVDAIAEMSRIHRQKAGAALFVFTDGNMNHGIVHEDLMIATLQKALCDGANALLDCNSPLPSTEPVRIHFAMLFFGMGGDCDYGLLERVATTKNFYRLYEHCDLNNILRPLIASWCQRLAISVTVNLEVLDNSLSVEHAQLVHAELCEGLISHSLLACSSLRCQCAGSAPEVVVQLPVRAPFAARNSAFVPVVPRHAVAPVDNCKMSMPLKTGACSAEFVERSLESIYGRAEVYRSIVIGDIKQEAQTTHMDLSQQVSFELNDIYANESPVLLCEFELTPRVSAVAAVSPAAFDTWSLLDTTPTPASKSAIGFSDRCSTAFSPTEDHDSVWRFQTDVEVAEVVSKLHTNMMRISLIYGHEEVPNGVVLGGMETHMVILATPTQKREDYTSILGGFSNDEMLMYLRRQHMIRVIFRSNRLAASDRLFEALQMLRHWMVARARDTVPKDPFSRELDATLTRCHKLCDDRYSGLSREVGCLIHGMGSSAMTTLFKGVRLVNVTTIVCPT